MIAQWTTCSEQELIATAANLNSNEWPYPKSDFSEWVGVLNRFDSILETCVKVWDLKNLLLSKPSQTSSSPTTCADASSEMKPLVLSVLKITKLLWENCTTRNLYSSFEVSKQYLPPLLSL